MTIFEINTVVCKCLRVKPPIVENMTKGCVYSIPRSCDTLYKDEICHPLKIKVGEHHKALTRMDIRKSRIADQVWKNWEHFLLCDESKIIGKTTTGKYENQNSQHAF